jgi:hypothetical protein
VPSTPVNRLTVTPLATWSASKGDSPAVAAPDAVYGFQLQPVAAPVSRETEPQSCASGSANLASVERGGQSPKAWPGPHPDLYAGTSSGASPRKAADPDLRSVAREYAKNVRCGRVEIGRIGGQRKRRPVPRRHEDRGTPAIPTAPQTLAPAAQRRQHAAALPTRQGHDRTRGQRVKRTGARADDSRVDSGGAAGSRAAVAPVGGHATAAAGELPKCAI